MFHGRVIYLSESEYAEMKAVIGFIHTSLLKIWLKMVMIRLRG